MTLRLISLVLFFLSLINYSLWRDERTARKLLEEELIRSQPEARASLRPESLLPEAALLPPSLEQSTEVQPAAQDSAPEAAPQPATEEPQTASIIAPEPPAPEPTLSEMSQYGVVSRVGAIAKFVTLTDEQRERLRQKYTRMAINQKAGLADDTESLETIIGEQNASFFRQQAASAFQKSREQELDREIFYLSRKLAFTSSQEIRLRELMAQVEEESQKKFSAEKSSPDYAQDASFRVRLMMQENQFKSEWLASQLKETLTSDQYQAYLQEEADSSGAELSVWHAP